MDNKKFVMGMGLPRTGGTTLAEALRALGYHGKNSCIVTNVMTTTESTIEDDNSKKFLIDNKVPAIFITESWNNFSKLYNIDANTKFILTTRPEEDWLASLTKFKRRAMRGSDIPIKDQYEDLVKEVIKPENLLIINWTECKKKCWKRLCDFLNEPHKPLEGKDFPCENC